MSDPVPFDEFKRVRKQPEPVEPDPRPVDLADDALARTFAEHYQNQLRYVEPWGRWHVWDGAVWRPDTSLQAFDLARAVCRDAASRCTAQKVAAAVLSAKTIAATERLAKTDRRLVATVDQWDADPWAINTPDGIVYLRTGRQLPHDLRQYCTKQTRVGPGGECPIWFGFLDRVTDGDRELQFFLQRMAGYALTGDTSAHALFFLYGTGSNGKSVFLDTLAGVLADYATTAPIETFTASTGDRHPTDLAGLRGARLVMAIETEEGRRWAESRIKSLTGGDRISARFMRQDFFEFTPQFKLLIAGNHKPGLRSVDEAMRRRFHLVPFTVTIPPHERDPQLKERLKAEWPGILRWAIQGCLDWQKIGLEPPQAVRDATAIYLEAEDAFSAWLEECCETDPAAWASSAALYGSWCQWAEKAGEFVGSSKRLAQVLEARGFIANRTREARGYTGLRVRPAVSTHWSSYL
jgi:putative DNA primase/helicase